MIFISKVQTLERGVNGTHGTQWSVSIPLALAKQLGLSKGEQLLWTILDNNRVVITRANSLSIDQQGMKVIDASHLG